MLLLLLLCLSAGGLVCWQEKQVGSAPCVRVEGGLAPNAKRLLLHPQTHLVEDVVVEAHAAQRAADVDAALERLVERLWVVVAQWWWRRW